jgi:hypothetical protein
MSTAPITASANGDNVVVAAVPGRRIRVLTFVLSFSAAVNAKFLDGAGGSALSGLYYGLGATAPGFSSDGTTDHRGIFTTSVGNALVLNLSGAIPVGGHVIYELVG